MISRALLAVTLLASSVATTSAIAADNSVIVGTWQVKGYSTRFLDNNEVVHTFGDRISGYIQYSPGGHMVVFLVGGERKAPAGAITDAERSALFSGIFGAYAGTYKIDGAKVVHRVVASWNETFTSTDQVRYFEVDGKKLI